MRFALKQHSVLPGFGISLGYTLLYLSLIVLVPLAGLLISDVVLSQMHGGTYATYFGSTSFWLVYGCIALSSVLGFGLRGKVSSLRVLGFSLAGSVLFVAPLAAWASAALNPFKAPRPLVALAGALNRYDDIRIACWEAGHLPSLNFYVQRDVALLGDDTIHAVHNPLHRFTGAIHVYGGDFFTQPRSEFDPITLAEQPYDVARTLELFRTANATLEG